MELGAQARFGLLRQFAHLNGGPHMVASTRRLELDLVEFFDARHSSHATPAALLNSYVFYVRTRFVLAACSLKCVPETAAQRVPHLVVQQEVDRQRRPLQKPRLKVRGHPRLSGEYGLKPQRRSVTRHRFAERLAFLVCRLHRVPERDAGRTARVTAGADKAYGAGRRDDVRLHSWDGGGQRWHLAARCALAHGGRRYVGQRRLPARRLAVRLLAARQLAVRLLAALELAALELAARRLAAGLLELPAAWP